MLCFYSPENADYKFKFFYIMIILIPQLKYTNKPIYMILLCHLLIINQRILLFFQFSLFVLLLFIICVFSALASRVQAFFLTLSFLILFIFIFHKVKTEEKLLFQYIYIYVGISSEQPHTRTEIQNIKKIRLWRGLEKKIILIYFVPQIGAGFLTLSIGLSAKNLIQLVIIFIFVLF